MIRRTIKRKTDQAVERQVERLLDPPPVPLPVPVALAAAAAQWTGIVLGAFIKGVERGR